MWGILIAHHVSCALAGHRLTLASDQEAALSGLDRDVLLSGWLLTASNEVLTAALVPSSFSLQLQMFRVLLCLPSSFVLPPQSVPCMPFASSVHAHFKPNSNCHPDNFAKAGLCKHPQNCPILRENMWAGTVIHMSLSAWAQFLPLFYHCFLNIGGFRTNIAVQWLIQMVL